MIAAKGETMGIWLLTIESSLCIVVGLAFWLSVVGRCRRWIYLLLGLLWFIYSTGAIGALTGVSYMFRFHLHCNMAYFPQAALLAGTTIIGGLWLLIRGATRLDGRIRAASWPRLRLLLLWLAVGGIQGLTILRMDSRIRASTAVTQSKALTEFAALVGPMPNEADNARALYDNAFAQMNGVIADYDRTRKAKHFAIVQKAEEQRQQLATRPATRPADDPAVANLSEAELEFVRTDDLLDKENAGKPQTVELLARLEPTIAALKQATTRPSCRFQQVSKLPTIFEGMNIPHADDFRYGASLFRAHAIEMARRGRLDAALADTVAIERMGNHIDQTMPSLVSCMLRTGMNGMVCDILVEVLPYARQEPELPPGCLPDPSGFPVFFDHHMRGEGLLTLGTMLAVGDGSFPDTQQPGIAARVGLFYRILWLEHDLQAARTCMAGQRERLQGRPPGNSWQYTNGKFSDGSPFLQILFPPLSRIPEIHTKLKANAMQAQIALALTRHRLKTGAYPVTLDALMPLWLPAIPTDPFDGQPMRYRLDGRDAIIYSVGPDKQDDGGAIESTDPRRRADVGFRLRWRG